MCLLCKYLRKNKICNNINVNGLDTVYLLYVNYEFDDINKSKPINQFVLHQTQQSVNSGKINSLTLFGTNTDTDMLFYDLIYSRLNVDEILFLSNFFVKYFTTNGAGNSLSVPRFACSL